MAGVYADLALSRRVEPIFAAGAMRASADPDGKLLETIPPTA